MSRGSVGGTLQRGGLGLVESQNVLTILINGTLVQIDEIESHMASVDGSTLVINNANPVTLTSAAAVTGPNAELYNAAQLELGQNATMGIPSGTYRNGSKLTFIIAKGGAFTLAWTGGAGGYRFANAASLQGVKVADFNALLAAAPTDAIIRVGFEYTSFSGENSWDCVALAGYWP